MEEIKKHKSFDEFYLFYLTEHSNPISRRLHFIGTGLVLLLLPAAVLFHAPKLLLLIPVVGYGFAWIGHLFFEKNRPATFKYPLWSLASDFKLFFEILSGKQKI
ncbi:DUF962 domain-containing protein [Solitalea koreensis]|uniref:DUF962 domain-containing protein n=1 Tax=Solitalea koreensis TaxID=543615 RepID=A0A521E7N2_9SPHI|nr:DUF962 domain-containing protein [Solitalea koreensis]SMO79956.1 hypothetical protein SAMN06265350_11243 [Solitalea koreensis]